MKLVFILRGQNKKWLVICGSLDLHRLAEYGSHPNYGKAFFNLGSQYLFISKYHTMLPSHVACFNLVNDAVARLEGCDKVGRAEI